VDPKFQPVEQVVLQQRPPEKTVPIHNEVLAVCDLSFAASVATSPLTTVELPHSTPLTVFEKTYLRMWLTLSP
jgi:hypothetical protein